MEVFFIVNWSIVVYLVAFKLSVIEHRLVVLILNVLWLKEIHTSRFCFLIVLVSCSVFHDDLTILSIQKLTLLETKLTQVTRKEAVLLLSLLGTDICDAISTNPVKNVNNDQIVTTTDLIFEASSHS